MKQTTPIKSHPSPLGQVEREFREFCGFSFSIVDLHPTQLEFHAFAYQLMSGHLPLDVQRPLDGGRGVHQLLKLPDFHRLPSKVNRQEQGGNPCGTRELSEGQPAHACSQ